MLVKKTSTTAALIRSGTIQAVHSVDEELPVEHNPHHPQHSHHQIERRESQVEVD